MIVKIASALALGLVFVSCLKDKTIEPVVDVCEDTVFYATEIQGPIMNAGCAVSGCHNSGTAAAGFVFESHAQVSLNATSILSAIKHDGTKEPMPLGGPKLNESLIQKFDCWIKQGKLNN
jgi:hypothetical protein